MRSDKYMERIILEDLETFKRKADLASEAVKEYVRSVENEVRRRVTYNIQNQFKELQDLLQEACQTLNRVVIGLASMVPSSDNNLSRPIVGVPRPMVTSDCLPSAQWSSSDSLVRIDNARNSSSPSPDIIREAMVEPSSSSASSTSSATHAPYKARIMEILRKRKMRSSMDEDEFAMEIPEPSVRLNPDAPEFKQSDVCVVDPKSSCSLTSTSSDADTTIRAQNTSTTHMETRFEPLGDLQPSVRKKTPGTNGQGTRVDSNPPKTMTSSSSEESFETASATDCDQNRDHKRNLTQRINRVAGFEIASLNGFGAGDNVDRLAPNSYTDGAESRPSSLSTRNVIYDTEQVLRGTAEALREQAPNGFAGEAGFRLPNRHATNNDVDQLSKEAIDDFQDKRAAQISQELADRVDNWSRQEVLIDAPKGAESPSQAKDGIREEHMPATTEELEETLARWAPRQTPGVSPCDVRKTRIPPLWNYVHVSISEVDAGSGRVYVQMLADEYVISKLTDEVNAHSSSGVMSMRNITKDLLVMAPFCGNRYRARIVSKESEDNIEVFFIDHGNKAIEKLQDLSLLSNKKHTKTCKMAIPCVLDDALMSIPRILDELPETMYVCLADPFESDRETVYRIMDIMLSTNENSRELPDPVMFNAFSDPSRLPYTVVLSHATSPAVMWLVEQKDLEISEKIEEILEKLPPEKCLRELLTKSVYIAYRGQRAMVVEIREDRCDLLLLDTGKSVEGVPISACRRLPLLAHMMPRAAKLASLANCAVPEHKSNLGEQMMAPYIGRTFDMKKKNDENDEVILVDPSTGKYLAKELKAKYGL